MEMKICLKSWFLMVKRVYGKMFSIVEIDDVMMKIGCHIPCAVDEVLVVCELIYIDLIYVSFTQYGNIDVSEVMRPPGQARTRNRCPSMSNLRIDMRVPFHS